MPTNRQSKTRTSSKGLLECEKHLLLRGECVPAGGKRWGDYGESWVRPFILVSPGGREQLKALWTKYGAELSKQWKQEGHRGSPWAARELAEKVCHADESKEQS
jgi:hypothetical protein